MRRLIILGASFLLFTVAITITILIPDIKSQYKHEPQTSCEYNIAHPAEQITKERFFTIVIPSYNNEKYAERNIRSALDQEYGNYEIFFIDDCSMDRTLTVVEETSKNHPHRDKLHIIRNEKNLGALANFYNTIHQLDNQKIVVVLDGDDHLAHNKVLEKLNSYYENPDVWITYGSYLEYPSYREGTFSRPIDVKILKEGSIKRKAWLTSHLRTFYAGLFNRVPLSDFLHKGKFYPSSADTAMMLPMIELAREHTYFIPEIFYIYNYENPNNDTLKNQKQQQFFDGLIRKIPCKTALSEHPSEPFLIKAKDKADVFVFSYNRPLQLYACLESIDRFIPDYENIFVLYRASEERFEKSYDVVKKQFKHVQFFEQPRINPHIAFKPMVLDLVFNARKSSSKYIAFCTDDIIVKEGFSLTEGILALKETDAYGVYYRLGSHISVCFMTNEKNQLPLFIPFKDKFLAWEFDTATGDFDYPNSVDFTLYEKNKIERDLKELDYKFPNKMEEFWSNRANHELVGLCYTNSKIVNIPLNIVSEYEYENRQLNLYTAEDLQQKFEDGLKLDISPLYNVKNISAHIDYDPNFIPR